MRSFRVFALSSLIAAALIGSSAAAAGTARQPAPGAEQQELKCLALNIYFEARGEPLAGKIAVGHVVLNRVANKRFPNRICAVVQQGGEKHLHRCQFSWWCDGLSDRPKNKRAWEEAIFVAKLIREGMTQDPTNGALWYHAAYVKPAWAKEFGPGESVKIGRHIFYGAERVDEIRVAGRVCRPNSDWTWSA